MNKIRLLIVDDAVVVRRLLVEALSSDPAVEVVGTAPNGRVALAKVPQVNPDVVILDMDMPPSEGVEVLSAFRKAHPFLPVILFKNPGTSRAEAWLEPAALEAIDPVLGSNKL